MKLYYHPFSTYARRVWLMLLEKNIDAELVEVDMINREHRGAAFLAKNPYGRVPVLEDGDLTLCESAAIMAYLEARFPEPALLPADVAGRARASMHLHLCDSEMAAPTGVIIFPKRFMPPDRWDQDAMAAAVKKIERHLGILSAQIGDQPYVLGDQLSLVDLAYLPFIEFLPLMEIQPPANIAAWRDRLQGRESAKQTKPAR